MFHVKHPDSFTYTIEYSIYRKGDRMNSDIVGIITSVGFPIVACIAMGYYVKYVTDQNRKDIHDMNELHRQEMSDITSALNNNTVALEKLCTMLDKGE